MSIQLEFEERNAELSKLKLELETNTEKPMSIEEKAEMMDQKRQLKEQIDQNEIDSRHGDFYSHFGNKFISTGRILPEYYGTVNNMFGNTRLSKKGFFDAIDSYLKKDSFEKPLEKTWIVYEDMRDHLLSDLKCLSMQREDMHEG